MELTKDPGKKKLERVSAALNKNGFELLDDQKMQLIEKAIAEQVGIRHFQAEVLPAQKAEFVKNLQQSGKAVIMVGDDINDSNALAQADVSIAMGKGSDIAGCGKNNHHFIRSF